MKPLHFLLILVLTIFIGCKKTAVDESTTKSFQSSINDMTSSLPTIKQIKFNEALYILKKFGVEGNDDFEELKQLGKLLDGKKVPEILAMADQVAQKNGIAWSSSGPPSLGEMNIFGNETAKESDPNDVVASSLSVFANPISKDSILGPKALQIIPRLVDNAGNPINFTGAGLETIMEVSSGGTKLITSKNLMQDNNFRGFTVRFASLPSQKIINNQIDVKVTVKTTKKTYQMTKAGIPVNAKALLMPVANQNQPTENSTTTPTIENTTTTENTGSTNNSAVSPGDPKTSVSKFLNNLSAQNLKAAYDNSQNPNWGSYETFANPTSGFGAVKNLNVKNISTNSSSANAASVDANYDVTDKNGKTTSLKVTFGLKNVDGEWKISSYKIN